MNVVIWARVSSREQREGYSIDAQLRATRDRATKNGWTAVREFVVAESAKRGAERLAFNEMFRWVRANARKDKIQAILSHKLDRVCRNMRDAVRLQELEDDCGVQLSFVENQFSPGAAGALSFNVMAAVAQYYSDNLRTEVLKGMDEKVRQGWPTGHAPFGYVNVDDRDEPVKPHPEKAKVVTRIFELYATGDWTFERLSDYLASEGLTYQPSQPRFNRTTLAYILNNRFYVGELVRNGRTYPGKYKVFIDRTVFDACQDVLQGRNRRTGHPTLMFSGGLLRCAFCGRAVTGEVICRELAAGGVNAHAYYKCPNNNRAPNHPNVRWREADLDAAITEDLQSLRMPTPEIAEWFREAIRSAFADVTVGERIRKQALAKRQAELRAMLDRLLNGFLSGAIDEPIFKAKSDELKNELSRVEADLESAAVYDPEAGTLAVRVFDFSQNLAECWHGSNSVQKREILNCVSSNRLVSDVNLALTKRKPFDFIAERPFFKDGRGDWIRTSDLVVPNHTL